MEDDESAGTVSGLTTRHVHPSLLYAAESTVLLRSIPISSVRSCEKLPVKAVSVIQRDLEFNYRRR